MVPQREAVKVVLTAVAALQMGLLTAVAALQMGLLVALDLQEDEKSEADSVFLVVEVQEVAESYHQRMEGPAAAA